MPRTLSPDTIAALSSGSPRFSVLVRIETPSLTLRMTSDTGPVVFGGETYTPGTLGGIGTVKEGGKMEDTSIGIDFSGVDVPTLAVAASPDFLNSPVSVWLLVAGGGYSGSILLFSGFTAGAPSISYGQESRVVVQCKGKFSALDRSRTERYADADQQRKYPGDLGMQYASIVASREVVWPAASWYENQG